MVAPLICGNLQSSHHRVRFMGAIYDKIKEKLTEELHPEFLEITDESEKHKGHTGWRTGGETHFAVTIVSKRFSRMPRLTRHRLVLEILQEERSTGIHALSISAHAPGEFKV